MSKPMTRVFALELRDNAVVNVQAMFVPTRVQPDGRVPIVPITCCVGDVFVRGSPIVTVHGTVVFFEPVLVTRTSTCATAPTWTELAATIDVDSLEPEAGAAPAGEAEATSTARTPAAASTPVWSFDRPMRRTVRNRP